MSNVKVGSKVVFNGGEETRTVTHVAEFITFDDKSWIDWNTWKDSIADRTIVVLPE
jgi:hypothetical protein